MKVLKCSLLKNASVKKNNVCECEHFCLCVSCKTTSTPDHRHAAPSPRYEWEAERQIRYHEAALDPDFFLKNHSDVPDADCWKNLLHLNPLKYLPTYHCLMKLTGREEAFVSRHLKPNKANTSQPSYHQLGLGHVYKTVICMNKVRHELFEIS